MIKAMGKVTAVDIAWNPCSYRFVDMPEMDQTSPFFVLKNQLLVGYKFWEIESLILLCWTLLLTKKKMLSFLEYSSAIIYKENSKACN